LIDDAVRSVGDRFGHGAHDETLMRLAAAAHTSHPDWVIRLAMGQAASIMDANTAGHYDLAVQWLEKAALAYEVLGRECRQPHTFPWSWFGDRGCRIEVPAAKDP